MRQPVSSVSEHREQMGMRLIEAPILTGQERLSRSGVCISAIKFGHAPSCVVPIELRHRTSIIIACDRAIAGAPMDVAETV